MTHDDERVARSRATTSGASCAGRAQTGDASILAALHFGSPGTGTEQNRDGKAPPPTPIDPPLFPRRA